MTPPRLRTPTASSGTGWLSDAACRHGNPDLWFDPHHDAITAAAAICHDCPVTAACHQLRQSLPPDQRRHGVWAGKPPAPPAERPVCSERAGTWAGVTRHRRAGQRLCLDCRAVSRAEAQQRRDARTKGSS